MLSREIDQRTKKDIIERIKKVSVQYTPEWYMDEEDPDMGSVLALLYADIFSDTIKKFNYSLEKNKLSYFDSICMSLLPAVPAKGYVSFGLPPQMEMGTQVPRRTQVLADKVDEDGKNLVFETVDDVFVTPAKITDIYATEGAADKIFNLYENTEEQSVETPFFLVDEDTKNLQKHEWIWSHPYLFELKTSGEITLILKNVNDTQIQKQVMTFFEDDTTAVFSYLGEEGYEPFHQVNVEDQKIHLKKDIQSPPFERDPEDDCFKIRCQFKKIKAFETIVLEDLMFTVYAKHLMPEAILVDGIEQKKKEFFPFNERPTIYSEFYMLSDEAFQKKNGHIYLEFDLDFIKVPLNDQMEERDIDWKILMRRRDFKTDKAYDITIEEVIWEYYNGLGWSRLFPDGKYENLFTVEDGDRLSGQHLRMDFICPKDMEKVLVNASESYCIRAKVLKVQNAYKTKGAYITPMISDLSIAFDYEGQAEHAAYTTMIDNLCWQLFSKKEWQQKKAYTLGIPLEPAMQTWYMGFDMDISGGPLKLLWVFHDTQEESGARLQWEYYSKKGWKNLNAVDETRNLARTGLVTWIGRNDGEAYTLFGKKRFWIRIRNIGELYQSRKIIPKIEGIFLNATKIVQLQSVHGEKVFIASQIENQKVMLAHSKIYDISVWLEEREHLSIGKIKRLEEKNKVRLIYNERGEISKVWVLWDEVSDFAMSGAADRHYRVDRQNGILYFSDGIHGAIPDTPEDEALCIDYTYGGGAAGNLLTGQINALSASVGFVNQVYNPTQTYGGCDMESIHGGFERASKALKHRYRCVTEKDYEAIACMHSRNIIKIKCFSNINAKGLEEHGAVTLAILPKDYEMIRDSFEDIYQELLAFLPQYMDANVLRQNRWDIVKVVLVEMKVRAEILVPSFNDVFEVREKMEKALKEYLDPVHGNIDHRGWTIGRLPNTDQMATLMKGIVGVAYIKDIAVDTFVDGRFGKVQVPVAKLKKIFMLPKSGEHEFIIDVKNY